MKNNYLARQKRQFKGLCKKISKNWNSLSSNQRENLLSRFRRLYDNLKSAFARPALSKMMGAAAVVLMSAGAAQAQQFAAGVENPFGLSDVGTRSIPVFIDIDNDGDMDMFSGETYGQLFYYENTGTATTPLFASNVVSSFGLNDFGYQSAPTFGDLDGDGLTNLIVGRSVGNFAYREDTSSIYPPYFGPSPGIVLNPVSGSISKPVFVDIDNDNDLDVFSGDSNGSFFFYENSGTPTSPALSTYAQDTFGLASVGYQSAPTFVDIDGDGDYDLFAGETYASFYYFENTGTASAPSFAASVENPFGLVSLYSTFVSTPTFVDIDNDGDMDMFSGDEYGNFHFYENLDSTIISSTAAVETSSLLSIYPNPVSEALNIELATSANYQIRITDITGREVYSEFLQGENNLQLSTKAWPAGLYLLQVRDEEGNVETKKVVKQ